MESKEFVEVFKTFAYGLIVIFWLSWLWKRRHFYAFALSYPGKLGWPIFGNLIEARRLENLFPMLGSYFENINQTVCTWLGVHPYLMTTEPDVVRELLSSPDYLGKCFPLYEPIHIGLLKVSLITSPVDIWRSHRKQIQVAFKTKTLVSFFPYFNDAKKRIVHDFEQLADRGATNVHSFVFFNVAKAVKGTLFDEPADDRFLDLLHSFLFLFRMFAMQLIATSLHLHKILIQYPKLQQQIKAIQDMVAKEMRRIISEKSENANKQSEVEKPIAFINQIIKLYEAKIFSWNDAIGECETMLMASLETSTTTLYMALIFLATNPETQERLYDELKAFYPDKQTDVQYEDLEQLPYLEMVMQETMRLAPAVSLIGRQITTPLKLPNGKVVPTGFNAMISILHLHRRKDIWGPNAANFDPEHFLPDNIANRHPFAFIPFSKGARNCIGWRLAIFSLKSMLIGVIRNFKLETDFKFEDIKFKFNIGTALIEHPNLNIKRRLI